MCVLRLIFAVFAIAILIVPSLVTADDAQRAMFNQRVAPLLAQRCLDCHNATAKKGGLDLSREAAARAGGDSGVAIVAGKPDASLLWERVSGDEMPPKQPLSTDEKETLRTWIGGGAPWGADPIDPFRFTTDTRAGYDWWSLQPVARPPVPAVNNTNWPRNEIDRFVLARLDASGIAPAPRAEPLALLRRVYFDLLGLPPLLKEKDGRLQEELLGIEIDIAALRDDPAAFASLVDKLLDSPHYGERWGRHWLDVARYADSNGGDVNYVQAHAWRYRDHVIAAFNHDVPYDRFLVEQIAGDLLPAADRETRNRHWVATGLLAIGPKPLLKNDNELAEMDVVDEQIDTVGRAVLGLTLGCARCHDHKFDPIAARDYYALAGIFKSTQVIDRYVLRVHRSWTERALGSEDDEALHRRLKDDAEHEDDLRRLAGGEKEQVDRHIAREREIRKELAQFPVAIAVREGTIADCALHLRGSPELLGETIPRGFPPALGGGPATSIDATQSGRLQFARWLVAPENPLTSRVMVNRIWLWHFGEGLVRSPDNFGRMGQRPDHPQLLDWLATQFVESGWSITAMHRLMMNSAVYQMSSQSIAASAAADPENRLLWRANPRRLEAEEIRDAMLAVSGQLDRKQGGTLLPATANFVQADRQAKVLQQAYASRRRSVFLPVIRSGMWEYYKVFDCPSASVTAGRRDASVVASQALFMMNSELVWKSAESLAAKHVAVDADDVQTRIGTLHLRTFARLPADAETQRSFDFVERYKATLERQGTELAEADRLAWQALCRSLLATNEFIYLE